MSIHQIDWNAIDWKPVREGVDRKSFTGAGATLALHRLMPGHTPSPHKHPHEQIVYILQGRIRMHVEQDSKLLGAGSLMVIPPNAEHWGAVEGDEVVLNLDVFTPKRAEYAA